MIGGRVVVVGLCDEGMLLSLLLLKLLVLCGDNAAFH